MDKIRIDIDSADQFVDSILIKEDAVIGETLWKVRKALNTVLLIDLHRPNHQAYCDVDIITVNDIYTGAYKLEIYHCKLRDEFINIDRDNYDIGINDKLINPQGTNFGINVYHVM